MKNQLKSELAKVKDRIDAVIAGDSFPDTLEPEELRSAVRSYPMRGGKRLRPALLLWSCGAVGGNPEFAVAAAAAVEVYHNWTLVHDDIIDCDEFRRGVPTEHVELRKYGREKFGLTEERAKKFGTDFAILTGDVQQAWAANLLLGSSGRGVSAATVNALAIRMQTFLNRGLISGEALDVEFEYRKEAPSREEVSRMIGGKTGVLLSYCAASGAMIGLDTPDHTEPRVRALSEYARLIGEAYQLCDDLLGVYGEEKSFGKPICSDFREGKPTVLALEAFRLLDEKGKAILRSLTGRPLDDSEIAVIRHLIDSCGARAAVAEEAKRVSVSALKQLYTLPASDSRDLLEELAAVLLARTV